MAGSATVIAASPSPTPPPRLAPLLEVAHLTTSFFTRDGIVHAVDGVSFDVLPGEVLAIVGESGCGKTVTALSVLRLVPSPPGRIVAGTIRFAGRNLLDLSEAEMRAVRGNEISMIFQEPMTSLNPVLTVGRQIAETLTLHRGLDRRAATRSAIEMLRLVHIPDPAQRAGEYPHQLSGGMRQRVMIAMALACNPRLLIADEPTTALDVTIQAQILDLMRELKAKIDAAIILITHDLGVVAEMAERVVVMYAGRKAEEAPVEALFHRPLHPYTQGLLASVPRLGASVGRAEPPRLAEIPGTVPSLREHIAGCPFAPRCGYATGICHRQTPAFEQKMPGHFAACFHSDRLALSVSPSLPLGAERAAPGTARKGRLSGGRCGMPEHSLTPAVPPLLSVRNLVKHFPVRSGILQQVVGQVRAVDGISLEIAAGETLGLVGESGCGKSTAGKAILKLIEPNAGEIRVGGERIDRLSRHQLRPWRRRLQMVFQDPYSSLNPRFRVRDIIAEPLVNYAAAKGPALAERVAWLAHKVGLPPGALDRFPHEFSGGQRQRIGIARALALNPSLIVCDEPVSALDVSVQAQIINLLRDLQSEFELSYLFVAHDLAVVEHISHRIAVMYLGQIVETADKHTLFTSPQHPYTEALLSAVPVPDPGARSHRILLKGDVPSSSAPPSGCRFRTRCPHAFARCAQEEPATREIHPNHFVACHLRDPDPADFGATPAAA